MYSFPIPVPFKVDEKLGHDLSTLGLCVYTQNRLDNAEFMYGAEPLLAMAMQQKIPKLAGKSREEFLTKVGGLVNLPGGDMLLRRVRTLDLPESVREAIERLFLRDFRVERPTLAALVLTPSLQLGAEQAATNAALAPFGLRLDMTIHDLWFYESSVLTWVQGPEELTDVQLRFLGSPVEEPTFSFEFVQWAKAHRFDPSPMNFVCRVLEAWAFVRLSRDNPFRTEMETALHAVGLTMDSNVPYGHISNTSAETLFAMSR